jgi:hypothetical protein
MRAPEVPDQSLPSHPRQALAPLAHQTDGFHPSTSFPHRPLRYDLLRPGRPR